MIPCPECDRPNPPGMAFCPGCSCDLSQVAQGGGDPDGWISRPIVTARPEPEVVAAPGLVISVGDQRHELADGESCFLGRSAEAALFEVFRRYPDVGATHAQVRAVRAAAEVTDQSSRHGTFVADQRLAPHASRRLVLPVTIRFAGNCFVRLESREGCAAAPTSLHPAQRGED